MFNAGSTVILQTDPTNMLKTIRLNDQSVYADTCWILYETELHRHDSISIFLIVWYFFKIWEFIFKVITSINTREYLRMFPVL